MKGYSFRPTTNAVRACLMLMLLLLGAQSARPQDEKPKSIGGKEHDDNILGVRIGMDVETALKSVFINANRKPGQEKPDALRHEGKDKKDIRVLYNDLKIGKLQIVFANGQWVKEIVLDYAQRPTFDELRLAPNGNIYNAMGGQRYDDRYTIGYTEENEAKRQRVWYRDEKTDLGYRERIEFTSGKHPDTGEMEGRQIVRKTIYVTPGDEEKFLKAIGQ
ncbi:MAG: hypothetical protein DMF64_19205 [Acidobacteria bacterium]|nr:MAG: hypothetical protein DMF64_19205 [Acidobacteriota bacterium]